MLFVKGLLVDHIVTYAETCRDEYKGDNVVKEFMSSDVRKVQPGFLVPVTKAIK